MSGKHFDVIVVGVGSMGAAACWFLSKRGFNVLGLEQFTIPHDNGSHGGQTRIIRKAYFEHPDYVPLLQHSYENWRALEKASNTEIYHRTGIVYFGKHNGATISGLSSSAQTYGIPINAVLPSSFPQFNIPSDFECVVEPDAGFIPPELALATFTEQAKKSGATIIENETVIHWASTGSGVEVRTRDDHYTGDNIIFTAGSWTEKLLRALPVELVVTRQILAWFKPHKPKDFNAPDFPCWFIEDDHGIFYGFPYQEKSAYSNIEGLKVALHKKGEITDPNKVNRNVERSELTDLLNMVREYIPGVGEQVVATKTCLYTYSQDENFIIDHLPGYDEKVTIACGFSGHGFKFASVVGEILADLSTKGKTDLPIEFLRLKRFDHR